MAATMVGGRWTHVEANWDSGVSTDQPDRRAEQLAGGIYGTIVVAGLLAATGPDDNPEAWPTALWVQVVTVLVFLACALLVAVDRPSRDTGMDAEHRGLRRTLSHHWPIFQAAFPPVVVMLVAAALGANDDGDRARSAWSCVLLLAGWGVLVGRQEHESPLRIAPTSLGCASLGALMIVLKIVIH